MFILLNNNWNKNVFPIFDIPKKQNNATETIEQKFSNYSN
jgi:hypothetical protein